MKFIFLLLFLSMILIIDCENTKTDESPGFFLKVTKNVPRLGKRSDTTPKRYFHKTSKNIPRIGRRNNEMAKPNPLNAEKAIPSYNEKHSDLVKRKLYDNMHDTIDPLDFYEYNVVQPVDSNQLLQLLASDIEPNENLKFVAWKDFDRALQHDPELFQKMISIGKDIFLQIKQDMGLKRYMPLFDQDQNNNYGNNYRDELFFYEDDSLNEIFSDDERKEMKYQM